MIRELIIYSGLFLLGNYLDYYTTYLGMENLPPEEMKKRELNVFLDSKIHNKKFILLFKGGLGLLLITLCVIQSLKISEVYVGLKVITVLMFVVALGNLYSYLIRKKGKLTPGAFLMKKLRFPKALTYFVLLGIDVLVAILFTGYVLL